VINRSRMGLPAFTAREIEKECLDLERRRSERKLELEGHSAKKNKAYVNKVQEDSSSSSEMDSSSEDAEESYSGGEATLLFANEIKQQKAKYFARGRPVDPQKVYRRATKNFNARFPRFQKKAFGKEAHGARQALAGQAPFQGPPNDLGDSPRKNIYELLALANCTKGQCVQCGLDGHYLHQDACALKDKRLKDRPCVKCGKGLHQADDCPKAYQQKYSAEAPKANANVVKEEPLNEK